MQFDVFISYSTHDKATADAACAALENAGIRCWIAPRDILPGADWGEAIINALDSCRAVVLIFSANANSSPQIRREIERAVGRGIPLIPVRIEDTAPTKAMAYFMGAVHWLDAMTPPLEQHLRRLAESLQALLGVADDRRTDPAPALGTATAVAQAPAASAAAPAPVARPVSRMRLLIMRIAVLIATGIGGLLSVATIVYKLLGWLPITGALTFISYWLVFRNLTAQQTIAKVAALGAGAFWAYLAMWNATGTDIGLVVIEGTAAACLLYVATELARLK
jgi:TIR domain